LIAPDYITINADGTMQSRAEMMQAFGKFKGSTYKLSGQQIRQYGNTAIITGKASFFIKSFPVATVFYTEIWVQHDGDWLFTGWQGTMTGRPSWYPVIFTVLLLVLLLIIIGLIRNRIRRRRR